MANPFLVEDISSSVKESNTFNPFLTDASSEINENPFFTSFGGTNNVQDNTNPFFSFTAQPEPQPPVADLLNINEKPQQTITNDSKTKPPPPRPTPPKRPPPRPMPPPALSHEAKELILSVTGEIDATSTHMLDRLAKTPSPTPIRELLTPSPLPTPDLIGDEDLLPPAPSELSLNELQSTSKPERPKFPPKVEYHPDDTLNYISTAEISENSERISKKRTPSIPEKPPSLNSSKPSSRKSSNEFILPVRRLSHDVTESRKIMPDLSKISDRRKSDFGPFSPILTTRQPTSQSDQTFKIKTSTSIKEINESEENKNDEHSVTLYNLAKENSDPSTKINTDNVLIDSIESSQDVPLPWQDEKSNQSFDSQQPEITYDTYKNDLTHQNIIDGTIDSLSSDLCENEKVVTYNFDSNLKEDSFEKISALSSEYISDDKVAYNAYESKPTPPVPDPSPLPEEQNTVTSFVVQNNEIPENAFIAKPVHESFQTFSNFESDAFDAFDAKFDDSQIGSVGTAAFDAFGGPIENITDESAIGFGADDNFDSFLSTHPIPAAPQSTPARVTRNNSGESIDENDFNVYIRPKVEGDEVDQFGVTVPSIAPPPKPTNIFQDGLSSRFNPFDQAPSESNFKGQDIFTMQPISQRTDSQETPPSPLFDEDVSQPLEEFPRVNYNGDGWEMELRQPNKKKITAHRFWKKIFVKIVYQGENPVLQLYNLKGDKDPFQELPLQPSYSVSDIGAQQYDQFGKIFTVKLLYIFYKEKAGFRPGQVTKAERLTNKLSQFAAYAIQGDYQGVKEFGSDIKKLGLPVEHGAQTTTLLKLGSHSYEDMKQFSICIEESLFKLSAHRDRALNYKVEDVQITVVDELFVDQNSQGSVLKQTARVRLFFLAFMCGMPDVEVGVNDLVRQGKEVVGRHDIIPVVTEEWIRLEGVEFHNCVQQDEYERTRTIKFKPPDACYIELMRFRVRPPKNRELPLQLKTTMCITGNKVELKADVLVPGFTSRKLGQVPCEDVAIRFPIPECWIYLFRVEKHFRYGSVKSAHRRTGKVKGIERFLGTVDNLEPHLIEVTSGEAKYEHHHRSVVWRMHRLPKEGQGAYTTHNLVCRMTLTSYDQVPEQLDKYCYVEFTMPTTQVSHTTVRSVSIVNSEKDSPPEKYLRLMARHEYRVEIEHIHGEVEENPYLAATAMPKTPQPTIKEKSRVTNVSDSDSSS